MGSLKINITIDSSYDNWSNGPPDTYLLFIMRGTLYKRPCVRGLLLQKMPIVQGRYQRIGYFDLPIFDDTNPPWGCTHSNPAPEDWNYLPEESHYVETYNDEQGVP